MSDAPSTTAPETGYAPANGLEMYYEIHNAGAGGLPVLLLHGAYMWAQAWGPLLAGLASRYTVIVPDQQAHGRTGDIDRPITYPALADDAAALLAHLGIERAHVVGYSMGGAAAIQAAIRHPELVEKLVAMSAGHTSEGAQPELAAMIPQMAPEMFAGSPFETTYKEIAPDPDAFPTLVAKVKSLNLTPFDWSDDVPGIAAPTLTVLGDGDAFQAEYAVGFLRLRGGGGMGDLAGPSRSRLAILPGTTHYVPPGFGMLDRHELLVAIISDFLDAGPPEPWPPVTPE